jgi:hypothetical protein
MGEPQPRGCCIMMIDEIGESMKTSKNTKVLIILSVVLLIAFSGCVSKSGQVANTSGGDIKVSEVSGQDWCKSGTKMMTTGGDGKQTSLTVKGMVNYEGREVCEASWDSSEGTMTTYMNKDSTYYMMIVKDKSGNMIKKIDMSQPK